MQDEFVRPDFWNRVKNRIRSRKQPQWDCLLEHDASGIKVTQSWCDGTVRTLTADWKEISKAIAHKRDCWATDLICISFYCQDGGFGIDEEMRGWKSLIEQLPRYLPGCKPESEWWLAVAFPAFVENALLIYGRV